MDAADILREIAFWLERERASTYRVEAFRTAADVLSSFSPAEVERRTREGSLKRLKGLGPRTVGIVEDVIAGEVPDYLTELRDRGAAPLADGGEPLRSLLRGDLHLHSDWSDGGSPIEEMLRVANRLGREYIALTDHSPRLTVARGLSPERLRDQLGIVADLGERSEGTALLSGIEVDILDDGDLDQEDDLLERLDVVVASAHSQLRMRAPAMTRRLLNAVSNPRTRILGHCTGRLVTGGRGTRPPSEFDARAVFEACSEHDVAVEINARPERQDPPDDLIAIALDAGCLFSIDSDAHAPGQLDFLDYGAARAVACGVPAERIVTTWPLDDLLAWVRRE